MIILGNYLIHNARTDPGFLSLLNQNVKELHVTEDLQLHWKILQDGKLVNFDGRQSKTVHLPLKLKENNADFLRIHSQGDFYLFINSDLITKSRHLMLNVDSLKKNTVTFFC